LGNVSWLDPVIVFSDAERVAKIEESKTCGIGPEKYA
jgi:hypothetical protein